MPDQPTTGGGVLDALRPRLTPVAHAAGFAFADASPLGEAPKADISFLEYRADLGGRRLLLDLCEDPAGWTVVAELWDPDRLRAAGPRLTADEIARRRLTWRHPPGVAPEDLARAIATEIGAWLVAHGLRPSRPAARHRARRSQYLREVVMLEAHLARRLEDLRRQLARYATFEDPGAAETADRIAAVALAIEELDALTRDDATTVAG